MKEQFVDYKTAMMLRDLNFNKYSFGYYYKYKSKEDGEIKYEQDSNARNELFYNLKTHCVAPLWQQAKEWLWEKHKMFPKIFKIQGVDKFNFENQILSYLEYPEFGIGYDSPITTEIEGVKKAVKYLHERLLAATPINTNANGA